MSENINENNEQNPDNTEDLGPYRSFAQSIINKESSIDLSSIMQMATGLLNNDLLMNSVSELSKKAENHAFPVPEVSEKQENLVLVSLSDKLDELANNLSDLNQKNLEMAVLANKMDKLTNGISELKKELLNIKEQNEYLTKYVKKIYYNKK